jgi:hypothetical protein
MLKVNENKRSLNKDGEPYFFLADTVWSAFTNIEKKDWIYYLEKRKSQGFNTLQINLMPQWDRSVKEEIESPFKVENGYFNISEKNDRYFQHVEEMLEVAVNKGFTPALVLLWCNYIPETWAGEFKSTPYFKQEDIKQYTREVVEQFKKFNPIYLVSGDTDFPTEKVVSYYYDCLEEAEKIDPDGLKVLHIKRGLKEIPERLINHPGLDLYFYQSGHNAQFQNVAYKFAEHFYHSSSVKPTINSEPCYELMAYSRNEYGRFSRKDVRKVAWQSVFAGAFAGITYGAHGIWSWHDEESNFGSGLGEGFAPPYNWRVALEFEGADDYGYLKQFFETEELITLTPNQTILLNETEEIRIAETEDKVYVYLPVNVPLQLNGHFDSEKDYAIDLDKRVSVPIKKVKVDGTTVVEMTAILKDSVLVLHKK